MQNFLENHKGKMVALMRTGEREPLRGTVESVSKDAVVLKTANGIVALRLGGIEMVNVLGSGMGQIEVASAPDRRSSIEGSASMQEMQKSSLVVPSLNMPDASPIVRNR